MKPTKPDTSMTLHVKLPVPVWRAFKLRARRENRTMAGQARFAIEKDLAADKQRAGA